MALPKAIEKQKEEAEALHKKFYSDEGTPVPEETPPVEPLAEVPPVEPPVEVEPPATIVEAPPPATAKQPRQDWKHKYNVLQGKYDAEVPRLTEQVRAQQARLTDMENMLAGMSTPAAAPAEQPPAAPTTPASRLVTDDELEDYGADMIDVVKRAAREEFGSELDTLRERNAQLESQFGGMQQSTAVNARQQMLDYLDREQADWRELNTADEFLDWLENLDAFSGSRRLDMLRSAFEQNNGARVLAFFKGYLNENAAFTRQQPNAEAQPQVNLETLVAPGQAAPATSSRAQEDGQGRFYSQDDIAKFYRDVNKGIYTNTPEEKDRIERDIFQAQQDGRITA